MNATPIDAEVVIVGGGIAGGALATVLARAGHSVLLLERQEVHRDQVRGEWLAPWGIVVARRLGLDEVLTEESTRACVQRWAVFYDEIMTPEQAEASPFDMGAMIPGVPGSMDLGHPQACRTLTAAAAAAGAQVRHGVTGITVTTGERPAVAFTHEGIAHEVRPRLAVGADGRNSTVRNQLGLQLHGDPARTMGTGLLVDGLDDWPLDTFARGTCGQVSYFLFPQTHGRARLYLQYPIQDAQRFAGPDGATAFLQAFALPCLPRPERFPALRPAGPCAGYPWHSTWTDTVLAPGVVLIGDAGGYNDPVIGQGLSLALSDVADLTDHLTDSPTWTSTALAGYAKSRRVRMERARACAFVMSDLYAEFGPEAAARRAAAMPRVLTDPELALPLLAHIAGYDDIPEIAYTDDLRHRIRTAA